MVWVILCWATKLCVHCSLFRERMKFNNYVKDERMKCVRGVLVIDHIICWAPNVPEYLFLIFGHKSSFILVNCAAKFIKTRFEFEYQWESEQMQKKNEKRQIEKKNKTPNLLSDVILKNIGCRWIRWWIYNILSCPAFGRSESNSTKFDEFYFVSFVWEFGTTQHCARDSSVCWSAYQLRSHFHTISGVQSE